MNQLTGNKLAGRPCPVCGGELPPHVGANRCPHCLLRAGLESATTAGAETVAEPVLPETGLFPKPGERFGHYQVGRFLGSGGMGAVFEAEDLESGRRVALKVLGHRLDSPEARHRFFREGRLAASVNHPNSVYVFGTEEIAGVPVIAMELAAGGTLQGLVTSEGPLAVPLAVDYVLQIMAGLEAAQKVGILHRDIKPSNCFADGDGTIKIGDFGLSISAFLRQEPPVTVTGTFLGTPAFASPEQLRGDELTARSDIYSVGVTLYYLLTGHHPFEAPDMVRLLACVLERRAESPAKWRAELPRELGRVVLRCLEKNPDQRFPNYEALRRALLPFAPTAPTPATLGLRFLAGCIDSLLLAVPQLVVSYWSFGHFTGGTEGQGPPPNNLALWAGNFLLALAYYSLLEGWWGATVGKELCGLRVVAPDRSLPGVPRALLRAFVFLIPLTVVAWLQNRVMLAWGTTLPTLAAMLSVFAPLAIMVLRFSTARRRNEFAGWHDLASGTRVLDESAGPARPALALSEEAPAKVEAAPLIGPYHVLDHLGGASGGELFLGFDAQLLRRVWIRKLAPGAPPVPPVWRAVGRHGRLRWLQGQRTDEEAWDVYEAPPGKPLLQLLSERQCWSRARYWLFDLAGELAAAAKDGSLPGVLDLDRVWITAEGGAKLLDFPAPGTEVVREVSSSITALSPVTPGVFLQRVAASLLEGRAVSEDEAGAATAKAPLALHARRFLDLLKSGAGLEEVLAGLKPLLDKPATISRARRLAWLTATWLLPFPILALLATVAVRAFLIGFLVAAPEMNALRQCLFRLDALPRSVSSSGSEALAERRALEIYIAGRFAPEITNVHRWRKSWLIIPDKLRQEAERILTTTPTPSVEQFTRAKARVEPGLEPSAKVPKDKAAIREAIRHGAPLGLWLFWAYLSTLLFIVLPCLIASLLFRGGALGKMMGIVFVTGDGTLAPRWRVAGRNMITWLPFVLLWPGFRWLTPVLGDLVSLLVVAGLGAALAAASNLLPQRGLPDRLAGLWLVPR